MKLKITQPGWENFTGEFGGIEFVDGTSVDSVSKVQATRVANQVMVETLEGANPSSSQLALDSRTIAMDVTLGADGEAAITAAMGPKIWSRAELEALADAKGIAGVREITDPLGLKSNAVAKLIQLLLDHQEPPKPGDDGILLGSSVQPALFEVNGETIQLGTIVAAAFKRSGKTSAEWNDLAAEVREDLVQAEVTYVTGAAK